MKPKYEHEDFSLDVKFVPPKKEKFSRQGVFLPKKGERYNAMVDGKPVVRNGQQQVISSQH